MSCLAASYFPKIVSMLYDARLLCIYNGTARGWGCIPKVSAVNPILPLEPLRMLCTCALCPLWVLMAETVRSPFDYREPPTLDSDGDGSKPPPPRGWVSSGSDGCCCCCYESGHKIVWTRALLARVHVRLVFHRRVALACSFHLIIAINWNNCARIAIFASRSSSKGTASRC